MFLLFYPYIKRAQRHACAHPLGVVRCLIRKSLIPLPGAIVIPLILFLEAIPNFRDDPLNPLVGATGFEPATP